MHGASILQRFFRLANPAAAEACWEWTGAQNTQGYGRLSVAGIQMTATHVAWLLFRGIIAPGLQVLHRCDNPPCVNPAHLFLGTQKDNMDDCRRKGRDRRPRGEEIGQAKLTAQEVKAIRLRRSRGETVASIARLFGVCPTAVSAIIHRRVWRHVNDD